MSRSRARPIFVSVVFEPSTDLPRYYFPSSLQNPLIHLRISDTLTTSISPFVFDDDDPFLRASSRVVHELIASDDSSSRPLLVCESKVRPAHRTFAPAF